jgi:hypothetical protein
MLKTAQIVVRAAVRVLCVLLLIFVGIPIVAVATLGCAILLAGAGAIIGATVAFGLLLFSIFAIANAVNSDSSTVLVPRRRPDLRTVPKDGAA